MSPAFSLHGAEHRGGITITESRECPGDFGRAAVEDFRFYRAFQEAGIGDFEYGYLLACRDGAQVSIVPYFLTDYRLNTLVTNGLLKHLLASVGFKLACVGHPSTDTGWIEGESSADVLEAVNGFLRSKAAATAYKFFADPLTLPGFVEVAGLPNCVLRAAPDYPASLARRKRKNLLAKLAKSARLTFREFTPAAPLPVELAAQVCGLYERTAAKSKLQFERLNSRYFELTAAISTYLLAYEDARLIGFMQWLRKGNRMCGKYVGLDYERSRAYELYFGLAIRSIQSGVRAGVTEFELGAMSYYSKRLLGAELVPTRLYCRHHTAPLHWLLARCRFLLEPSAAELE